MIACTLSNLELRSIIESAFLPMRCDCTVIADSMTVKLIDPATDHIELEVSGIALDGLDTSRALCVLISELRRDLENSRHVQRHALAG